MSRFISIITLVLLICGCKKENNKTIDFLNKGIVIHTDNLVVEGDIVYNEIQSYYFENNETKTEILLKKIDSLNNLFVEILGTINKIDEGNIVFYDKSKSDNLFQKIEDFKKIATSIVYDENLKKEILCLNYNNNEIFSTKERINVFVSKLCFVRFNILNYLESRFKPFNFNFNVTKPMVILEKNDLKFNEYLEATLLFCVIDTTNDFYVQIDDKITKSKYGCVNYNTKNVKKGINKLQGSLFFINSFADTIKFNINYTFVVE